jgi:hypothetical protein
MQALELELSQVLVVKTLVKTLVNYKEKEARRTNASP